MAAEPMSVRLLRFELMRWVREIRPHDEQLVASVALATSEAIANVVRHAYDDDPGRVELDAVRDEAGIVVRVTDRGGGVRAAREPGTGLGMGLIGRVASGVTVVSEAAGTTVTMRFALPVAPQRRSAIRRSLSPVA